MSDQDKLFDQQVHDAFEGVSMSEEAQERMLSVLLRAQAEHEEEPVAAEAALEPAAAEQPTQQRARAAHLKPQAERERTSRRGGVWKVLLPLAAVLAVAAIVVNMQNAKLSHLADVKENVAPLASEKSTVTEGAADAGAAAEDEAVPEELYAESVEDVAETEGLAGDSEDLVEPLDPEMIESGGTPGSAAGLNPKIVLADGTVLTALVDGYQVEQVDAALVGKELGAAKASPFDADESINCTVFALVDGSDGYAVRYEGEEGYWYASRL